MFTEFAMRNRWIIAPLIVSAFLVVSIWAGADREGIGPSKKTGLMSSHNRSSDNDSLPIIISTRTDHDSESADIGEAGRVVSGGSRFRFAIASFSFGAPQWPQQTAGAYGPLQNISGVAPAFGGCVEKGLSMESLASRRWQEAESGRMPEINETCGMSSSEQVRWNAIHQHSPSSQGSVLVNF
jgi:hypothetical protein